MRTFTQSLRYTLGALSAAAFCEVAIADITGRNDLARDDGAAAGRGTALMQSDSPSTWWVRGQTTGRRFMPISHERLRTV